MQEQDQSGTSTTGTGEVIRENKNYSEVCQQLLTKKFTDYTFKRDDLTFIVTKVQKLKGEAQINIRKGKQIIIYEYEMECEWRAESTADECEGNFKIVDINESDLDFEVTSVGLTKENKIGGKARTILKKCLKDAVLPLLKDLTAELMAFENDRKKLEEDKKLREANDEKYKQIVAEKGGEKDKLLEVQKLAEEEAKRKRTPN